LPPPHRTAFAGSTHVAEAREVNHQAVVDAEPAALWPPPHRDKQLLRAAKVHGGDDIRDISAMGDQSGATVGHPVVDLAGLSRRHRPVEYGAAQTRFETGNCRVVRHAASKRKKTREKDRSRSEPGRPQAPDLHERDRAVAVLSIRAIRIVLRAPIDLGD
jgi:hypothetical protein